MTLSACFDASQLDLRLARSSCWDTSALLRLLQTTLNEIPYHLGLADHNLRNQVTLCYAGSARIRLNLLSLPIWNLERL
jgi:hypothetical protein